MLNEGGVKTPLTPEMEKEYLKECQEIVKAWEEFEEKLKAACRDEIYKYLSVWNFSLNSLYHLCLVFCGGDTKEAALMVINGQMSGFREVLGCEYEHLTPEERVQLLRLSLKSFHEEYLISKKEIAESLQKQVECSIECKEYLGKVKCTVHCGKKQGNNFKNSHKRLISLAFQQTGDKNEV